MFKLELFSLKLYLICRLFLHKHGQWKRGRDKRRAGPAHDEVGSPLLLRPFEAQLRNVYLISKAGGMDILGIIFWGF